MDVIHPEPYLLVRPCLSVSESEPRCAVRDQCLATSPCQNGGSCTQGTASHYQCECPHAWGGADCEVPRDPCETQLIVCGAGRTCSRDPASTAAGYSCNCHTTPGWRANSGQPPGQGRVNSGQPPGQGRIRQTGPTGQPPGQVN